MQLISHSERVVSGIRALTDAECDDLVIGAGGGDPAADGGGHGTPRPNMVR